MDFSLSAEQVELQRTVARLFTDRAGRPVWDDLVALGLLDLPLVETVLVFEQVGEHLVPGPLLWSVLAGTGEQVGGGEDLVEHAEDVDRVLVLGERATLHGIEAVQPVEPLDPSTPLGRVTLGPGVDAGDADELRRRKALLSAAVLTGLANRALTVAVDHAKDRHQFGVPIGSFQAIKHLLADRYVANLLAQSATYAAAAEDDERSARAAKLLATEAAIDGASTAIQVLGGMGFTWETEPHLLLKRAWVLAS